MSPSADQAEAVEAQPTVPAKLLDQGEVVVLAMKPSAWYVLLVSWPVLLAAALVAIAACLLHSAGHGRMALVLCAAAICLRIFVACCQWIGILYVLTNKRVMRLYGVARVEVVSQSLLEITEVSIVSTALETPLGVGSICFAGRQGVLVEPTWTSVARPVEVKDAVNDAIGRAR